MFVDYCLADETEILGSLFMGGPLELGSFRRSSGFLKNPKAVVDLVCFFFVFGVFGYILVSNPPPSNSFQMMLQL